jgi:hypothetical protein
MPNPKALPPAAPAKLAVWTDQSGTPYLVQQQPDGSTTCQIDIGDMTAINPALKKTIVKRQLQMTAINLSLHKVFSFDHSCRDRRDRLG